MAEYKDPEYSEYKRIKSFLLWSLGVTGTLISLIAAVVLFSTFGSMNEMKEELTADLSLMKNEIGEIKDLARGTLEETEIRAEKRLDFIEKQAELTAMMRVQEMFMTNRIQEQFEYEARKVFDKQLNELATEKVSKLSLQFEEQIATFPLLNIAMDQIRTGRKEGIEILDSLIESSQNEKISLFASYMKAEKMKDFEFIASKSIHEILRHVPLSFENQIGVTISYDSLNVKLLSDQEVRRIVNEIVDGDDLNKIVYYTALLRYLTKIQFNMLDYSAIKQWYKTYRAQKN